MNLKAPNPVDLARKYVRQCAPAISGQEGHKATFRVAVALVRRFGLNEAEALAVMLDWNRTCQPPWEEADLRYKITSALHTAPKTGPVSSSPRAKGARIIKSRRADPRFEPETLARIAAKLPAADFEFMKARSPICPETQTPATFLNHLYRPGEKVIVFDVFQSQGRHVCIMSEPPYDTGGLDHLRTGCLKGVWFLSNPVDGEFHPNPRQGNKLSRRSEESVTAWRYLLVESDQAEPIPWLAALVQLPLRIAAIYSSGRRSIHALLRLDAGSKADLDAKAAKLKPMLIALGADPKGMKAVQLTRLPGCYRDQVGPVVRKMPILRKRLVDEPLEFDAAGNPIWTPKPEPPPPPNLWTGGKLQELFYLNPEPDLTPICQKPTRAEIYQHWLVAIHRKNEGIGV
jgi:hypothetical protein